MALNLYLMRGVPGAGKSTVLRELGVQDLVIAPAQIKSMLMQPQFVQKSAEYGQTAFPGKVAHEAETLMIQFVQRRLETGSTTFIDDTALPAQPRHLFLKWEKLAREYGYELTVITVNPQLTREELATRNDHRPLAERLSPKLLDTFYARLHQPQAQVPEHIQEVVVRTDAPDWLPSLQTALARPRPVDLTPYTKVIFIGDVHNSYDVLATVMADLEQPDHLFVFTGDWFDRGVNPIATYQWLRAHVTDTNKVFLWGNHDEHLRRVMLGHPAPKTAEASLRELATLEAELPARLRWLTAFFQPTFQMQRSQGQGTIYASHSGSFEAGGESHLQPLSLFTRGKGGYDIELNHTTMQLDGLKPEQGDVVVHGHRNSFMHPVMDGLTTGYYNLEQQVESGGQLGVLIYDRESDNFTDASRHNQWYNHDLTRRTSKSLPQSFMYSLRHDPNVAQRTLSDDLTVYYPIDQQDPSSIPVLIVNKAGELVGRGFGNIKLLTAQLTEMPTGTYYQEKLAGGLVFAFIHDEHVQYVTLTGAMKPVFVKPLLKNAQEDMIKNWLTTHPETSMLFEVVDGSRLIPGTPGVYLVDILENTLAGNAYFSDVDRFNQADVYAPMVKRQALSETIDMPAFIVEQQQRQELAGIVLTTPDHAKFAVATDQYLARKQLARKLNHAVTNGDLPISRLTQMAQNYRQQANLSDTINQQIETWLVALSAQPDALVMAEDATQVDVRATLAKLATENA